MDPGKRLLIMAVFSELRHYVQWWLTQRDNSPGEDLSGRLICAAILAACLPWAESGKVGNTEMLRLLLESGLRTNSLYEDLSPLGCLWRAQEIQLSISPQLAKDVISLLLEHGASPAQMVHVGTQGRVLPLTCAAFLFHQKSMYEDLVKYGGNHNFLSLDFVQDDHQLQQLIFGAAAYEQSDRNELEEYLGSLKLWVEKIPDSASRICLPVPWDCGKAVGEPG